MMLNFHQMSDDELTDQIARGLGWFPSDLGHGFYSKEGGVPPVLFGPTYITQHFFEACESAGVDGGRYRFEEGRWVHQLLRGNDSSIAEHESFLRAGCIALARFLQVLNSSMPERIAV
ncbi:MAG: hypothetical protein KC931_06955 [Candidatus Omnitrophica bacterium]|nr:hypothetical protein [Candidatus Omnitrophota bacterium]MCA9415233.1 hypothetical protein [Candidatus Omnitrophota bacterium]MCA9427507.1 hypothetical protein [Candidatus Omnitrophota bacterium]MCA9431218.1 hypothetical protein [Candidatus Omnitrophota bacterium]MCA9437351.1 hypothetical protein [Candidatus Omnitrophota bacterium]